ncbi:MAG: PadR family transcriptional regulator, partial [Gordonia sp. (in: high G+C Gram-positive bacteria)]
MPGKSLRLTPLAVMVLALLREGDMHPYEMARTLKQRRNDRMVPITNGTLYHTVARLQDAELVREVGVDREGNRPERTTYTLTDAGRDAVVAWVRAELPQNTRPAQFRVALAEAHNLDRAEAVELLSQRRDALIADLDGHHAGLAGAAERDTPP